MTRCLWWWAAVTGIRRAQSQAGKAPLGFGFFCSFLLPPKCCLPLGFTSPDMFVKRGRAGIRTPRLITNMLWITYIWNTICHRDAGRALNSRSLCKAMLSPSPADPGLCALPLLEGTGAFIGETALHFRRMGAFALKDARNAIVISRELPFPMNVRWRTRLKSLESGWKINESGAAVR